MQISQQSPAVARKPRPEPQPGDIRKSTGVDVPHGGHVTVQFPLPGNNSASLSIDGDGKFSDIFTPLGRRRPEGLLEGVTSPQFQKFLQTRDAAALGPYWSTTKWDDENNHDVIRGTTSDIFPGDGNHNGEQWLTVDFTTGQVMIDTTVGDRYPGQNLQTSSVFQHINATFNPTSGVVDPASTTSSLGWSDLDHQAQDQVPATGITVAAGQHASVGFEPDPPYHMGINRTAVAVDGTPRVDDIHTPFGRITPPGLLSGVGQAGVQKFLSSHNPADLGSYFSVVPDPQSDGHDRIIVVTGDIVHDDRITAQSLVVDFTDHKLSLTTDAGDRDFVQDVRQGRLHDRIDASFNDAGVDAASVTKTLTWEPQK